MLRSLGACAQGVLEMSRFLPAKISTNPERNLPLALKLAKAHGDDDGHIDRAHWFAAKVLNNSERLLPDSNLLVGDAYDTQYDAFIIAQWLAWSADYLATKAGR